MLGTKRGTSVRATSALNYRVTTLDLLNHFKKCILEGLSTVFLNPVMITNPISISLAPSLPDAGFPSVCYKYVLLSLVIEESVSTNGLVE